MVEIKFKKGDVVQLKSGGPWMTIEEVDQDDVSCAWFLNNELKRDEFEAETLEIVNTDKKIVSGSAPKRNNYW
jgi:uncharacterized protein YodC (DUF2158 family)